ncbi:hypothetical protein BKA93DRAFT_829617 [Sparassis latifolia]
MPRGAPSLALLPQDVLTTHGGPANFMRRRPRPPRRACKESITIDGMQRYLALWAQLVMMHAEEARLVESLRRRATATRRDALRVAEPWAPLRPRERNPSPATSSNT